MMTLASLDLAAHAADVQPATIRQWVRRGQIPRPINGLYDMIAILHWTENRNTGRAVSARHQRHTQRADRCSPAKNV